MPKKIRVGILFGGKSAEHEVSLQSARNVNAAIDRDKYDVVLIGIDKQGRWRLNDASNFLQNPEDPKAIKMLAGDEAVTLATSDAGRQELMSLKDDRSHGTLDVVFPVLHGPLGEDGTVQGLLKLADVPFVGAGVLGSAIGMDKVVMKRLLREAGLPIADFISIRSTDQVSFEEASAKLGLPLFVKPANLGSSVGIHKVKEKKAFDAAIRDAFGYDNKIVIEAFIAGREIECSVLGNESPIASLPGEVIPKHEFYSYEAKYIDDDGAALQIPAELSPGQIERVQELAKQSFVALECEGMARVDLFLTPEDHLFVNEINTIPGFTRISMYPKLWEITGIGYAELIDRLIQLALERHQREKRLKTSY